MSPVVLATRVGAAKGSRAVAAALACAASEPDRAALLVDLAEGRVPRPTLIATAGARGLEERLTAHLPDAAIASRGRICHLKVPPEHEAIETLAAVLPLARESAAVVHLPPSLLRAMLGDARIRSTGVLLRADLSEDRALAALTVRDLVDGGLQVGIVKRPLGLMTAGAAQFGASLTSPQVSFSRSCERLLRTEDRRFRRCYDGKDETRDERQETRPEWGRL